jgi:hypothetical protein
VHRSKSQGAALGVKTLNLKATSSDQLPVGRITLQMLSVMALADRLCECFSWGFGGLGFAS